MFNANFKLAAQRAGILFNEDEYYFLQRGMRKAEDEFFVIIENQYTRSLKNDFPYLRFKFPVETTLESLNSEVQNFPDISYETLNVLNKHFFVFGDSGK